MAGTRFESERDEMIREALRKGWSIRRIRRTFKVGADRISAVAHGDILAHHVSRPLMVHDDIKTFAATNWLAKARIGDMQMARMVNERYGARFVGTTMCRLRNEPRIRWRPPLTIQLLTDVQKGDSFPVVSDD
jgi:hypothetical protein